jgi:hypothetical protein
MLMVGAKMGLTAPPSPEPPQPTRVEPQESAVSVAKTVAKNFLDLFIVLFSYFYIFFF